MPFVFALQIPFCRYLPSNGRGFFTHNISATKDIKQGCDLLPLPNIFLFDLPSCLAKLDSHPPKLNSFLVPILPYADDVVILSYTGIGPMCLLLEFTAYLFLSTLIRQKYWFSLNPRSTIAGE